MPSFAECFPESEANGVESVEEETVRRSKYEGEVSDFAATLYAALSEEDGDAVREVLHSLAAYRKQTLLTALRGLVRHGSPEQRRNALYALALSFGAETSKMRTSVTKSGEMTKADDEDLGVIGDGIPESPDAMEREAKRSHDIVCAVADGLEDNDASVRQAAMETMLALESEERGVLAQQVLSGEDADAKRHLLSAISDSEDRQDLMLSIAALGSDDPSVRTLAAANVKAATGQDFRTQDEALEWVESHTTAAVEADKAEAALSEHGGSVSTSEDKVD